MRNATPNGDAMCGDVWQKEALEQIYGAGRNAVSQDTGVLLCIRTRKGNNVQIYLTTKGELPNWGTDARRVVVDFDTDEIVSGQEVKDAPLGCNLHALLPPGVRTACTKQYWKDADVLRSSESPNPGTKRRRKVTIVGAEPSPPSDSGAGNGLIANDRNGAK